jgi:hypothetical protein
LNAGSATDAFSACYQDNSSFNKMAGPGRAAPYAGGIGTMIAPFRSEFQFNIGVGPVDRFGDPIPAKSNWDIIFCLAGDYTITAPDTFAGI